MLCVAAKVVNSEMAVGSKDLSIDKLAELSNEELAAKLSEAKKELFNIRFQEVTGQANAGRSPHHQA